MVKRAVLFALVLACTAGRAAAADELNVGDAAPALAVKEFVKGDPVAKLEAGKVYVVEFWATWCGPCRTSIPHISELQKKYKDAVFIGVSVWEQDQKAVKPFVEEMGDKMAYRVALDDVTEGTRGKMAETWMTPAGQSGIPASFIVNRDGKIAWIGHPMQMDQPLEQIVKDTYDLKAAATKHKARAIAKRKLNELRPKLAEAGGDQKKTLAILEQAIQDDAALEPAIAQTKFRLLAGKEGDLDKAATYGARLVEIVFKDDSTNLNELAWSIVDPDAPKADAKLVKVALLAAQRADDLTGNKDAAIGDTLAKAYFDTGDVNKALELQERAMKNAKGTGLETDADMKKRLEQYRQAAGKK